MEFTYTLLIEANKCKMFDGSSWPESCHFLSIDNSGKLYLISYIILNIFQNGKGILLENRKMKKNPTIID